MCVNSKGIKTKDLGTILKWFLLILCNESFSIIFRKQVPLSHGRNYWGSGGPDLPKIWTDPQLFT